MTAPRTPPAPRCAACGSPLWQGVPGLICPSPSCRLYAQPVSASTQSASPEGEPPRECSTPDCTLILAHDGPCIPAGSYSSYAPAPSPSSGAGEETRPLVGKAYRDWLDEQEGEIGMRLRDAVAALAPGESLTIHRGHRGGLVITPQTDGSRALAAALRAAQPDTTPEER